ncbi:MAG: prolyl aminopeptidase [Methylococcales bacterium]|nr:prolyl aminopeptidase [Methylococcales bacterium]
MTELYPEIEPFVSQWLDVGDGHQLYVEQCGNPDGIPVLFLHGGPCSGAKPKHRRFFDASRYHAVLFDQRGCGRSQPFGRITHNTSQHLVVDIETIRKRLGIDRWLLFGGSWGATLALLYAQNYPQQVSGMILRGSFLARRQDLAWFTDVGVNRIYPECWQALCDAMVGDRTDLIGALWQTVNGTDSAKALTAARAWAMWGAQTALGHAFSKEMCDFSDDAWLLSQTLMELHYARHRYFLRDNQLLEDCYRLQHIPVTLLHGRMDLVCPVEAAWVLQQALPKARLNIIPEAGHISEHPALTAALVAAADTFARELADG